MSKIIEQKISKEHIIRKISDWKIRIENLYKLIELWVNSSEPKKIFKTSYGISMYEELMQKFKIEPENLKTAEVYMNGNLILYFKPKGLWVIGSNGRIDILHKNGSFILVDMANEFQEPIWKLYNTNIKGKKELVNFTKDEFMKILSLR